MAGETQGRDWFWLIIGCGGALTAVICAALVGWIGWIYLADTDAPAAPEPILIPTPLETFPAEIPTLNVAPTATLAGPTIAARTSTPAPTSAVLPRLTGSAAVVVARAGSPPQIDGSLAEWGNMSEIPLSFRVFTRPTWDGTDDLAAVYRLQWDNTYLYLAVAVEDDRHVQTFTGRSSFRGDSLELQFDTDRPGDYGFELNGDDYQFVISPGDFAAIAPEAYRFRGTPEGRMNDFPGHSVTVAALATGRGYVLEARIPWSDLGLVPQPGLEIGASLNANDNDQGGSAGQEIMISNVATRVFGDPTSWGTMFLAP